MQNIFQGKNASSSKGKMVGKVKTITTNVNVININIVIRSKIIKNLVFWEKEPRKNKSITNWEKEDKFKKTMVKTIQ
jgi:hypothetical protein